MKGLIVYASAGAGHFKAAQAVYDYLKEQSPSLELTLLDILSFSDPCFRFLYQRGYSFLVNRLIFFWGFCFWITDFKPIRPLARMIARTINKVNTRSFAKFLIDQDFDFILSTHFLPTEIAAGLKLSQKIKAKIISVVTDFGVHPFWISQGTDLYIAACEYTAEELVSQGVPSEKIKALGIPVSKKFFQLFNKQEIRNRLGLEEQRFTLLLMTGSFGIGPLEEIAVMLHQEAQVLVVCAQNRKLYLRLKKKDLDRVKVFAFVDNAEELMAASDMIITKSGGMSISETLAMELPPLFISVIPGQEEVNARLLSKQGIARAPKNNRELKETVLDYRDDPEKLSQIRKKMASFKKRDCLREISNVVCQDSGGPAGGGAV